MRMGTEQHDQGLLRRSCRTPADNHGQSCMADLGRRARSNVRRRPLLIETGPRESTEIHGRL
jgi:hypothetical protein